MSHLFSMKTTSIFYIISIRYQFILNVLLSLTTPCFKIKRINVDKCIYFLLMLKTNRSYKNVQSFFYRPKLLFDWKWVFPCRTILQKVGKYAPLKTQVSLKTFLKIFLYKILVVAFSLRLIKLVETLSSIVDDCV